MKGLEDDTYTMTEVRTDSGYVMLKQGIDVVISQTETTDTKTYLNTLIILSRPVMLKMVLGESEQMVLQRRSTTFSKVANTSLRVLQETALFSMLFWLHFA